MGLLSPILRNAEGGRIGFYCPGCESAHVVPTAPVHAAGAAWGWNGDVNAPTLTPSILVTTGHFTPNFKPGDPCDCNERDDGEDWGGFGCGVCHSFVTAGQIQFLTDCTHKLAGLTVPIPPWPADYGGME